MGSTKAEPTSTHSTAAAPPPPSKHGKPYGQIILTLKNQLLPEEKLACTPSQHDGLDAETETDLRIYGCELIQTAGILLRLPQVAMATGQVLLQRFYYSRSMVRHPVEHTAMACVCLASKIEEAPRDARNVINVFTHIRQVNSNKPIAPVILNESYVQLKNQVISAERRVLKELGFCVHIKHPHKIIVMYLQVLCLECHDDLMQYSWNYMNDSLRTDVFVRYQPETVACACIYLTARKLKLPLPKNPAWYTIFGARERDIRDVCVRILKLYNRPKPNVDELQKRVDELKRKYQDAKIRAKGATSGANTPNHCSPSSDSTQGGGTTTTTTTAAKTTGAHNAWGGFISRSGSHVVPAITSSGGGGGEKKSRSRTRSPSPSPKHHKRSKKHKNSRSRSPPVKRKSHKRRSYSRSRSRSNSPHKRKNRDRRKSRSASNDRENRNDSRYIDRYDKYDRYKDDRYDEKDLRSKKYDRDGEKERYSRRNKHRGDDDKDARDRDRSKDERSKDRRR